MNIDLFEKKIIEELKNNNLVIFAGAGVSMGSNYIGWKDLVRDIAEELELCVDREHDLISIAQYYYNSKGRNRNNINNKILNEFQTRTNQNGLLNVVARLPINTIWTTNYDCLIEEVYKKIDKTVDDKKNLVDLTNYKKDRDLILYKMHGDVNTPQDAVIIRDDYEEYEEKRGLFTTNLLGQMVSKTFLFLGYGFGDPNFEKILSRIRLKLGQNNKTHYTYLKKVKKSEFKDENGKFNEKEYKYQLNKQKLRIEDLKQYAIEVTEVDEYVEIEQSLLRIEKKLKEKNVFISGSAAEYGEFGDESSNFINELSCKLIEKNYKIFSGYGLGVGNNVIEGAMKGILNNELSVEKYFELRPFPQKKIKQSNSKTVWSSYRKRILGDCNIVIFMFGNKRDDTSETIIVGEGVIEEFEIAKELGLCIIPIASTGYAAKEILNKIKNELENFKYLQNSIEVLEKETNAEKILKEIDKIVKKYNEEWK